MGIKYADLEERWMRLEVVKGSSPADVRMIIESDLGYYDPKTGEWIRVGKGSARTLDAMALAASMQVPMADVFAGQPLDQKKLGEVMEALSYGVLSGMLPPPTELILELVDQNGNPVTEQGSVTISVPGRDPVLADWPGSSIELEATVQANIEVQVPGYASASWSGPIVGSTTVKIQLQQV